MYTLVPNRPHVRLPELRGLDRATAVAPSVCHYTPSTDPSGMGMHILDLVATGVEDGDVTVMGRDVVGGLRLLDHARALGATTLTLPSPRHPGFGELLITFLRKRRPDVFHCHVGIGWEDWGGLEAARLAGVPVVVQTQHLPFLLSHPRKRQGLLRSLAAADRIIAVSDGVRRTYEVVGVPTRCLVTIANGVRARRFYLGRDAARAALALNPDQPVVMTVGRLTHIKAQDLLVEATLGLARFADVAVVIVGEGPWYSRLKAQATTLGVDGSVHLIGHRPDARALLDAADVFVLPSRCEGMPLAAIEAMEAGLPVVATQVIGTDEVVVDGVTGTLVPSGDPRALGQAIGDLLADPARRLAYGAAGRRRYLKCFTAERMVDRTRAVYDALLPVTESALVR